MKGQIKTLGNMTFVLFQKRKEMIAHLKDQLQETKAKTSMETKYIKKDAEVRATFVITLLSRKNS